MEDVIKKIVAQYTKFPADSILPETTIDRSVVAGSIIVHRMYAAIAKAGFVVDNYAGIRTFGQLIAAIEAEKSHNTTTSLTSPSAASPLREYLPHESSAIGIDLESIDQFPDTNDYREHTFYKMNFSPSEIAYCILQARPQASFAGLFAAKEAMVKADNRLLSVPFNALIVDHLPDGKPIHPRFQLSISHTDQLAVAVAIPLIAAVLPAPNALTPGTATHSPLLLPLAVTAILLSLIALLIVFITL